MYAELFVAVRGRGKSAAHHPMRAWWLLRARRDGSAPDARWVRPCPPARYPFITEHTCDQGTDASTCASTKRFSGLRRHLTFVLRGETVRTAATTRRRHGDDTATVAPPRTGRVCRPDGRPPGSRPVRGRDSARPAQFLSLQIHDRPRPKGSPLRGTANDPPGCRNRQGPTRDTTLFA